ncbi:MAG: cobalamin biosynthesis protein [Phormidesmis sp. CAN_BIN36]|nr:cobalamin biosynthesis protein [Phormidesmis sp. CAN_BIN36]
MELLSVDAFDILCGWQRGTGDWAGVCAAIARQDPIQVIQEAGSTRWQSLLPPDHCFYFGFPDYTATTREKPPEFKARIWISPLQRRFAPESILPKVQWHPRVLWVGIGCQRGISESLIEYAIQKTLRSHHLAEAAIAGIATIDRKVNEAELVKFCRDRHLPLQFFSAADLSAVTVPNPSIAVEKFGTSSVSEAAAILAALTYQAVDSTIQSSLRVAKKIVQVEGQLGSVTVAIAQADREYTDDPKLIEEVL